MSSVVRLLREERVDLHISVSALRALEMCPRMWLYKYLFGFPPEDLPARLVLGGALHKSLAFFYRTLKDEGEEPAPKDLVDIATRSIRLAMKSDPPVLFRKGEDVVSLEGEANRLLTVFMEEGYRPPHIVAVEEPFALPLTNPVTGEVLPFEECIVGAIDLVAADVDNNLVVVDHKSSSRVDKQKTTRADLQMSTYSWAARQLHDVDTVTLRYQDLVRTKEAKVVMQDVQRRDHDEVEGMEAVASGLTLIHTAVTHPEGKQLMGRRRSWQCKDCGWRRRCREDRT